MELSSVRLLDWLTEHVQSSILAKDLANLGKGARSFARTLRIAMATTRSGVGLKPIRRDMHPLEILQQYRLGMTIAKSNRQPRHRPARIQIARRSPDPLPMPL